VALSVLVPDHHSRLDLVVAHAAVVSEQHIKPLLAPIGLGHSHEVGILQVLELVCFNIIDMGGIVAMAVDSEVGLEGVLGEEHDVPVMNLMIIDLVVGVDGSSLSNG